MKYLRAFIRIISYPFRILCVPLCRVLCRAIPFKLGRLYRNTRHWEDKIMIVILFVLWFLFVIICLPIYLTYITGNACWIYFMAFTFVPFIVLSLCGFLDGREGDDYN